MVDETRLHKISKSEASAKFLRSFGFAFNETFSFQTHGEPILVSDPTYLADVYNSSDENASFVRQHGVIAADFGGDISCPVWWQHPYVILPLSFQLRDADDEMDAPEGVSELAYIGCDSGSYVFLPLTSDIPEAMQAEIDRLQSKLLAARLELPPGSWTLYYEQFDPPENRNYPSWYRNVILKWSPEEDELHATPTDSECYDAPDISWTDHPD